jgi:hypothetical protein
MKTIFSGKHLEMLAAAHNGYLLEFDDGAGCKLVFLLMLELFGTIISSLIFFAVICTNVSCKSASPISARFIGRLRLIPQRQVNLAIWAASAVIIVRSELPIFEDTTESALVKPCRRKRFIATV